MFWPIRILKTISKMYLRYRINLKCRDKQIVFPNMYNVMYIQNTKVI